MPPFVRARQRPARPKNSSRRIKEGAIPVISGVEGFMGYYVVYAPDDTVIAISLFNNLRPPKNPTSARWRGSSTIWRRC